MVALAVWLVACGIVLCAVYLAVLAVAAVIFGLALGVGELLGRMSPEPRRRVLTPQERQRAAFARLFAEASPIDQAAARLLARRPYTAPSGPRQ